MYASKDLTDYEQLLKLHSRLVLDKRDKNGRIVFVAKLGKSTFKYAQYSDNILS